MQAAAPSTTERSRAESPPWRTPRLRGSLAGAGTERWTPPARTGRLPDCRDVEPSAAPTRNSIIPAADGVPRRRRMGDFGRARKARPLATAVLCQSIAARGGGHIIRSCTAEKQSREASRGERTLSRRLHAGEIRTRRAVQVYVQSGVTTSATACAVVPLSSMIIGPGASSNFTLLRTPSQPVAPLCAVAFRAAPS